MLFINYCDSKPFYVISKKVNEGLGVMQINFFCIFLFWCTFSRAMDNQTEITLDKKILNDACTTARSQIPNILQASQRNNPLNEPSLGPEKIEKTLHFFCVKVEDLLLHQHSSENFFTMHQRLKDLIPNPTYETFTLYKLYLEALEQTYKKAEEIRRIKKVEKAVYLILEETKKNRN